MSVYLREDIPGSVSRQIIFRIITRETFRVSCYVDSMPIDGSRFSSELCYYAVFLYIVNNMNN
jgi:hypothetical protein